MPSNNEMKQTKPALARMARSSLLISVFYVRSVESAINDQTHRGRVLGATNRDAA